MDPGQSPSPTRYVNWQQVSNTLAAVLNGNSSLAQSLVHLYRRRAGTTQENAAALWSHLDVQGMINDPVQNGPAASGFLTAATAKGGAWTESRAKTIEQATTNAEFLLNLFGKSDASDSVVDASVFDGVVAPLMNGTRLLPHNTKAFFDSAKWLASYFGTAKCEEILKRHVRVTRTIERVKLAKFSQFEFDALDLGTETANMSTLYSCAIACLLQLAAIDIFQLSEKPNLGFLSGLCIRSPGAQTNAIYASQSYTLRLYMQFLATGTLSAAELTRSGIHGPLITALTNLCKDFVDYCDTRREHRFVFDWQDLPLQEFSQIPKQRAQLRYIIELMITASSYRANTPSYDIAHQFDNLASALAVFYKTTVIGNTGDGFQFQAWPNGKIEVTYPTGVVVEHGPIGLARTNVVT
jgi:hypothetical protein